MDLDAYISEHQAQWRELAHLVGRSRLSAAEADRMLDLYERVGTHLSVIRSVSPDPELVAWLSVLLSRARRRSAPAAGPSWRSIGLFWRDVLPAALWRSRGWWLTTTVVGAVVMVLAGWWFMINPQVEGAMLTADELDQYVNHDFEDYYSSDAAGSFAFRVWTNNAWIAAQCIGLGVLGLPVIYILLSNCVSVGQTAALMIRHDRGELFFGLILPHGLLELTAVFVAAGVGLRLCWSWVTPGDRTRSASLAHEGRSAMAIVIGLVATLGISGLIEAFVTPSGLPTWARVGIGLVAWLLFLGYALWFGRSAVSRGVTGDLDEFDRGAGELTRA